MAQGLPIAGWGQGAKHLQIGAVPYAGTKGKRKEFQQFVSGRQNPLQRRKYATTDERIKNVLPRVETQPLIETLK